MLTKKERKQVRRAAELIEAEEQVYTCLAVDKVTGDDNTIPHGALALKYDAFYGGLRPGDFGFPLDPEARQHRILALLFFAEAG